MLGAGLQFGRSRGEDRFYNPAKARSARRGQLNLDHLQRALSDITATQSTNFSKDAAEEVNKQTEIKQPTIPIALEPAASSLCNLERFIESVTPSVNAQYLSKRAMREWGNCEGEYRLYFVLADLWESFKEWSVYGAGVPLLLNDTHSVVQYYVPFLSGMQLYGNRSKPSMKARRPGEDSDGDFRDSSSDGSSDCERDRGCMSYLREQHPTGEVPSTMAHLSLQHQQIEFQEGFSSDEGEYGSSQGCLLFEYLERDPPFGREPLASKISDLALRFPELKSLRSCDLQTSSWISVSWYPIYRIPMGPTLKDLDACFLTFHRLCTPMSGNLNAHAPAPIVTYPSGMDGVPKISLPVLGLASYKFRSSLWTDNGQLVSSLLQDADNWLTQVQVSHPDFRFFCRR